MLHWSKGNGNKCPVFLLGGELENQTVTSGMVALPITPAWHKAAGICICAPFGQQQVLLLSE